MIDRSKRERMQDEEEDRKRKKERMRDEEECELL
jgi:hypothetical protein